MYSSIIIILHQVLYKTAGQLLQFIELAKLLKYYTVQLILANNGCIQADSIDAMWSISECYANCR